MIRTAILFAAAAVVAAVVALAATSFVRAEDAPSTPKPAATATKKGLAALDWLSGSWTGSDGEGGAWETCYTSTDGASILSSSKEMRQGRTVMFDFEVWSEKDGKVVMTPYPHGKRSVDFTAKDFDPAKRRILLENAGHDFPRTFTYEVGEDGKLRITLAGEQGGSPLTMTLEFERRK